MTYNLNEIQLQVYPKFWCSNNLQIVLTTAQFKLPITEKYANLLEMHADEVNAIFHKHAKYQIPDFNYCLFLVQILFNNY